VSLLLMPLPIYVSLNTSIARRLAVVAPKDTTLELLSEPTQATTRNCRSMAQAVLFFTPWRQSKMAANIFSTKPWPQHDLPHNGVSVTRGERGKPRSSDFYVMPKVKLSARDWQPVQPDKHVKTVVDQVSLLIWMRSVVDMPPTFV